VRSARADGPVREALERAPSAKVGRPALIAGVVGTDAIKERLKREALPAEDFRWLAISLAVGDGLDVGAVALLPGPAEARDLAKMARRELERFAARPLVRLAGLSWLTEPAVLVPREGELHLAYRLAADRVDRLVARLESWAGAAHAVRP
jgi:hypothetical protein